MNMEDMFGPIIHSYTRAQAIEDGVLVDVSQMAREAGFKYPVAMTVALWAKAIAVPAGCEGLQDETGRLWDVLFLAFVAVKCSKTGGTTLQYEVGVQTAPNRSQELSIKLVCGPGDNAEPVITLMFPEED